MRNFTVMACLAVNTANSLTSTFIGPAVNVNSQEDVEAQLFSGYSEIIWNDYSEIKWLTEPSANTDQDSIKNPGKWSQG